MKKYIIRIVHANGTEINVWFIDYFAASMYYNGAVTALYFSGKPGWFVQLRDTDGQVYNAEESES